MNTPLHPDNLLAQVDSEADRKGERGNKPNWTTLELYKQGPTYHCRAARVTREGGPDLDSVQTLSTDSLDDVTHFFGHTWLAKELYAQAGLCAAQRIGPALVSTSGLQPGEQTFELAVTDRADLIFQGKQIASVVDQTAIQPGSGRLEWTELALYQTRDMQYVCYRIRRTARRYGHDKFEAHVCQHDDGVFEFFKHGWMGLEIYQQAGLVE